MRRTRTLFALASVAALTLTGCSGSGGQSDSTASDRTSGSNDHRRIKNVILWSSRWSRSLKSKWSVMDRMVQNDLPVGSQLAFPTQPVSFASSPRTLPGTRSAGISVRPQLNVGSSTNMLPPATSEQVEREQMTTTSPARHAK